MADTSRWDQRVVVAEARADDLPAMQEALASAALESRVGPLLAETQEGELIDWLTVAVHRLPDGSTSISIQGPAGLTELQKKGLLHDALWASAHRI